MKKLVLAAAVGMAGCGGSWEVVGATSENETFVIAETARISKVLGQKVVGEISTTLYEVNCSNGTPGCHATGWYVGGYGNGAKGTAYYYKTDVAKYTFEILTGLAAHEVCHSVTGPKHDDAHGECTMRVNGGRRS